MSKTSGNRIVLEGRATQRVPGFSLYMKWMGSGQIGFPPKDVLFELVGAARSTDPLDHPDEKYEVFISTSTLERDGTEKKSDRNRKLFCSNASPIEAIGKIRECVKHKYREYQAEHPPGWWQELPPADLEQIRVHNFMRMDSSKVQMQHLRDLYEKDRYVAGLFYEGLRVKAHFWNGTDPRVRFDTMNKDSEGIYREVPALAPWIGRYSTEIANSRAGTIMEGWMVHPKGMSAIGLLLGMNEEEAVAWQMENGLARFIATDCISMCGEWINRKKWTERQAILAEIMGDWNAILTEKDCGTLVEQAPYWEGVEGKHSIREWAIENGYEGVRFMMRDGTYNFNGRSWEHIVDLASGRYYVLVTGYVNATDTKHGPLGHVDKIRVGQYDENGVLLDVGTVDPWDETSRELLSRERERWMGRVLEVESVGYAKGKTTLEKARLVCLRASLRPEHCLFGVTTEVITP